MLRPLFIYFLITTLPACFSKNKLHNSGLGLWSSNGCWTKMHLSCLSCWPLRFPVTFLLGVAWNTTKQCEAAFTFIVHNCFYRGIQSKLFVLLIDWSVKLKKTLGFHLWFQFFFFSMGCKSLNVLVMPMFLIWFCLKHLGSPTIQIEL